MKPKSTLIFLLAAIAAAFIWGFFTIPLKHLHASGYNPQQILYYRVLSSFLVIWSGNLLFRRDVIKDDLQLLKHLPRNDQRKSLWLLLASGFFITANWFTFIYVVNHIGVKVAAFAYLICPLLTALGGFIILKEPLSRLKLIAVIIAIVSIVVLSTVSLSQVLWAILVAVNYAAYLVIQRVLTRFDKINMLSFQLLISMIILLPFYIYEFKGIPASPDFWINIVMIAVVFTILPLLLSLFALTGIPSSTLGITIYINPLISFAVAFLYFHERFEQSQILGYSLLISAVLIFNLPVVGSHFKKKKAAEPQLVS